MSNRYGLVGLATFVAFLAAGGHASADGCAYGCTSDRQCSENCPLLIEYVDTHTFGTIVGTIESSPGVPMPNCRVTLAGHVNLPAANCQPDGTFEFRNFLTGSYSIRLGASGLLQTLEVRAGSPERIVRTYRIAVGGHGPMNLGVLVLGPAPAPAPVATPEPLVRPAPVPTPVPTPVAAPLPGSLGGRVLGKDGVGADWPVTIPALGLAVLPNANGRYVFSGIAPGTHELVVVAPLGVMISGDKLKRSVSLPPGRIFLNVDFDVSQVLTAPRPNVPRVP
jgi:hypothetical protein